MHGNTELPQGGHSFSARVKDLKECSKEYLQTQSMERNPPHIHLGNLPAGEWHTRCCFVSRRQESNIPLPGTPGSLSKLFAMVKQTRDLRPCVGLSLRRGDVSWQVVTCLHPQKDAPPCFCHHGTGHVKRWWMCTRCLKPSRLTYGCVLVKHLKRNVGPHHLPCRCSLTHSQTSFHIRECGCGAP